MANTSHYSVMALILIFHIFITMAIAGRDIPNANDVNKPDDDIKKPDSLFYHDRGYLIPGVGRGIKPNCKDKLHPFTFSPITGRHDGGIAGAIGNVPRYGGAGGGRSYIPGGDDTFVPNPGFEVPNPASGGSAPGPVQG
uniref:putative cell wall protein n=1 Tax=Erigeron canadensis TaxID=72917 RepID=UPI001CB88F6D|nr:putative cell wall protein [Erigeron canadensis]